MKPRLIASALTAAIAASLVTGAVAQYTPGDVVVTEQRIVGQTAPLYGVTPSGSVYTITTSLSLGAISVAPAPDNRTLWVSGSGPTGFTLASVAPDGTIVNLNANPTRHLFAGTHVDGEGQAVFVDKAGSAVLGYRNNTFTTLFSGAPIVSPSGGGLDLATGDMIVVQSNGVFAVNLRGTPQATTLAVQHSLGGAVMLHPDVTSGGMIGTGGGSLYRVSPGAPPRLTTLLAVGPTRSLDYDPATQQFVLPFGTAGTTPAALLRFDPISNTATTITTLPTVFPGAATVAGSRHLAGISPAIRGGTYQLRVSSKNERGAFYTVAASFGTRGIRIRPGRTVYLTPDNLFLSSLTNSGIFSNFQGTLDAIGEAVASIQIPNLPALGGIRFYTAAVTFGGQGLSVISEPVGVTIR